MVNRHGTEKGVNERGVRNTGRRVGEAVPAGDVFTPADLTDDQAEEWRAVVNRMPAEWFPRETHALLADYCRHVVMARKISQLIQQSEEGETLDVGEYDRLGRMAERESRVIASLATKMRLTQQTTYDKTKKKPSTALKPWD